jgi:hypothetical protein
MDHEQHTQRPSFWRSPFGLVCTLLAIAASVYLYLVHKDHVLALLPYAILAACPLMHMFMHRGHSHGDHTHGARRNDRDPSGN